MVLYVIGDDAGLEEVGPRVPSVASRDHGEPFERRYVVARENSAYPEAVADLSPRERQAIALVSLGHSTRVAAYELGLAETTVRVLLMRAVRKLGARTRAEAIARFRESLTASTASRILIGTS